MKGVLLFYGGIVAFMCDSGYSRGLFHNLVSNNFKFYYYYYYYYYDGYQ